MSHKTKKTHKYVNPLSVPKKKKVKIHSDDPRNNEAFLNSTSIDFEVLDQELPGEPDEDESQSFFDSLSEDMDPQIDNEEDPSATLGAYPDDMDGISEFSVLDAPYNLYIDATRGYRLQNYSANGDGSVRWIATLYFDDVDGATTYDYTINAVEV
jgi:hypothetical protein